MDRRVGGSRQEEPTIVYDNSQIWVFNKPAGLAVQGGKGVTESLESFITNELYEKPYLVHRLDKETSGLILVAKNPIAAAKFSKLFNTREVEKHYKAIVVGKFPAKMEITSPIEVHGKLLSAKTSVKLVSQHGNFSLLNIVLHTGRTHQIRIHLQQKGYPIVGDGKYGNFELNRRLKKEAYLQRMMLEANYLAIKSEKIDCGLSIPQDFTDFLKIAARMEAVEPHKKRQEEL